MHERETEKPELRLNVTSFPFPLLFSLFASLLSFIEAPSRGNIYATSLTRSFSCSPLFPHHLEARVRRTCRSLGHKRQILVSFFLRYLELFSLNWLLARLWWLIHGFLREYRFYVNVICVWKMLYFNDINIGLTRPIKRKLSRISNVSVCLVSRFPSRFKFHELFGGEKFIFNFNTNNPRI